MQGYEGPGLRSRWAPLLCAASSSAPCGRRLRACGGHLCAPPFCPPHPLSGGPPSSQALPPGTLAYDGTPHRVLEASVPTEPPPTWARRSSWSVFTPKRGMLVFRLLLCISFFTPVICDMGWNCGPRGRGCWEGLCRGASWGSLSFIVGDGISTSFCLSADDGGQA